MNRDRLADGAGELGISLTTLQLDQFEAFEDALYAANAVMNLTRVSQQDCVERHFLDCLILVPLLEAGKLVLDIGSGPGFPAWPIACSRPDLQVVALDSSGKFHRFLAGQSLPNLESILARAEEFSASDSFDYVTGRAVARLSVQLELSARPACIGGFVLPMRSDLEVIEMNARSYERLGLRLATVNRLRVPGSDIIRQIPAFQKVKPTSREFPRPWAEMKSNPL